MQRMLSFETDFCLTYVVWRQVSSSSTDYIIIISPSAPVTIFLYYL